MSSPLEFGPFSSAEVRTAFAQFDLDHNSYIGPHELHHIFTILGEEVGDEEVDEMIKMGDLDGDGQINLKEFEQMVFKYAERKEPTREELEREKAAQEAAAADPAGQSKKKKKGAGVDGLEEAGRSKSFRSLPASEAEGGGQGAESKDEMDDEEDEDPQDQEGAAQKVPAFTIHHAKQRYHLLSTILLDLQWNESYLKSLLDHHRVVDLDIDHEELTIEEMQQYLGIHADTASSSGFNDFFTFFDDYKEGKASIRNVLVSLMAFISPQSMSMDERLTYAFEIFDRDKVGTLLDEDLQDLLKATYLGQHPDQFKKRTEQILKLTENPTRGEINIDEFKKAASKFPSLVFPNLK